MRAAKSTIFLMKKPIVLPKARAQEIILYAASLSHKGQFGRGPEAVYKVIDQLGVYPGR
jgi:hypothetical protein